MMEKLHFTALIIFKIRVFIASDMIFCKVGHNSDIKEESVNAIQFDSLRGYFERDGLHTMRRHIGKNPEELIAFRRGIPGGAEDSVKFDADGSNRSGTNSVFGKNMINHFANRGFPLGSRDANHGQLFFRMSEKFGGKNGERAARIFCYQLDGIAGKGELLLANKNTGTAPIGIFCIIMSVCGSADKADEKNSGTRFCRIVCDIRKTEGMEGRAFRM